MSYSDIDRRLQGGDVVILDGGTGTELERRGVTMDPDAWCGPAALDNADVLEGIHRDYILAGADIITANTFASSRLMLDAAGLSDRFEDINRAAVAAALRARQACGRDDVLVAGSLSHMCPVVGGTARPDLSRVPSESELTDAFGELATLLRGEGCDVILLEMMFYPERIGPAFTGAMASGLPVWAGFSARRGANGEVLSFAPERDIPFADLLKVLDDFEVAAAGVMHTAANVTGDAVAILSERFPGPLAAYPDSGHFTMPHWHFEEVMSAGEFFDYASDWVENGVQIVGGCCGLSPEHIATLKPLKVPTPN